MRNERRNRIALLIGLSIPSATFIYYFVKLLQMIPNPDSIVF